MSKRFLVILLAIAVVFGGILVATKNKKSSTDNGNTQNSAVSNHVFSQGSSGVELVEFGDFQCSACYAYEPTMKQVREKYKDIITFKFRNFPLAQLHPNALIAARAAEAADMQGKFWEMHDMLYENQDPRGQSGWVAASDPTSFFKTFAVQLGLNEEQFLTDLRSSKTNDIVLADLEEAKKFGFDGTPSYTLNGQKIERPAASLEEFSKIIDEAIKQKTTGNSQ